ncbi:MAG: heme-binding beta-barrel domain-containing protein [Burkholderiales bacterium]|jgi:hypothetical protein|nr:FABP family protein [Polynucleobacter sp.]MCX7245418.1 heme-binding beta-barrel domain-containing protein [Burkholderiales bacterium]
MEQFPTDIYTEPSDVSVDTLKNLGPLTRLAGIWEGTMGMDVKPKAAGPKQQAYVEHIELQPVDPQTNGPQLLYGLRYHTFITKPGNIKMYHDQVGYWLWDPKTQLVMQTLSIPRGQIAMASNTVDPKVDQFKLSAYQNDPTSGISSNPFLEYAFKTTEYHIEVIFNNDGTWSYQLDTILMIKGQTEPFHHTDVNTLHKIGEPTPNGLAAHLYSTQLA